MVDIVYVPLYHANGVDRNNLPDQDIQKAGDVWVSGCS